MAVGSWKGRVGGEKELYAGGGVAIDVEQRPRQAREALRAPFVSNVESRRRGEERARAEVC